MGWIWLCLSCTGDSGHIHRKTVPSPSCNLSLLSAPPDPFVAQCMVGCEMYPNRTSRAFAYVAYNGQDFLSFDTDNATWVLSQDTSLSRYVLAYLQNYTAFSELLEVLFNETCIDNMEVLLHHGKAALERQGETTLTLAWPPQIPHTLGPSIVPPGLPNPFALALQSLPWPQSSPARPAQPSSCWFAASPASTHGPSAWRGCGMARRCHQAPLSTPAPSCPMLTSPTSSAVSWLCFPVTGTATPAVCATAAWAPAASSSHGVGNTHGDRDGGPEPPCPTGWSKAGNAHGSVCLCFPGNPEIVLIAGLAAGLVAALVVAAVIARWVWRCR